MRVKNCGFKKFGKKYSGHARRAVSEISSKNAFESFVNNFL
jgi:hypothetical protein